MHFKCDQILIYSINQLSFKDSWNVENNINKDISDAFYLFIYLFITEGDDLINELWFIFKFF